jgi:hypothetical protein
LKAAETDFVFVSGRIRSYRDARASLSRASLSIGQQQQLGGIIIATPKRHALVCCNCCRWIVMGKPHSGFEKCTAAAAAADDANRRRRATAVPPPLPPAEGGSYWCWTKTFFFASAPGGRLDAAARRQRLWYTISWRTTPAISWITATAIAFPQT